MHFPKLQKSILHDLFWDIPKMFVVDSLLQMMLCSVPVFRSGSYTEVINIQVVMNSGIQTFGDTVDF